MQASKSEAARASLHMWEEPPDFGYKWLGHGVFLLHRSLGCVFCQNRKISRREAEGRNATGRCTGENLSLLWRKKVRITSTLLPAPIMCRRFSKRCKLPENRGFRFLLYTNSSGYEQVETLQLLDGHIDIYLPDYKYYSSYYAGLYSHAEDCRQGFSPFRLLMKWCARQVHHSLIKMSLLKRGTVIRHLMLPGLAGDTAQVLRDIASRWGDSVLVSLMRQYTPFDMQDYPELDQHAITAEEYADACMLFGELVDSAVFSAGRIHQREFYSRL